MRSFIDLVNRQLLREANAGEPERAGPFRIETEFHPKVTAPGKQREASWSWSLMDQDGKCAEFGSGHRDEEAARAMARKIAREMS